MNYRIAVALLLSVAGPAAAAPDFAAQFPARILAAHNRERALLAVPPLVWDNDLGTGAAAWAQQLALTNRFEHSDRKARRGIGENLWMGTDGAYSVEAMVGGGSRKSGCSCRGYSPPTAAPETGWTLATIAS